MLYAALVLDLKQTSRLVNSDCQTIAEVRFILYCHTESPLTEILVQLFIVEISNRNVGIVVSTGDTRKLGITAVCPSILINPAKCE